MSSRLRPIVAGIAVAVAAFLSLSGTASAAVTARTSGLPQSSNGASSMHLWWDAAPTRRIAVDLAVLDPGATSDLRYWALQVTFVDAAGKPVGGAHLGLQRHKRAALGAVNWGGYRADGKPLETKSSLKGVSGAPNTYDYAWSKGEQHRLVIEGTGDGWWTASIVKVATGTRIEIGRLRGGGTRLAKPVVWSEVFARCEAPSAAQWSGFEPAAPALRATYQSVEDGGCTNTDASLDVVRGGVIQRTARTRTTPNGTVLEPTA